MIEDKDKCLTKSTLFLRGSLTLKRSIDLFSGLLGLLICSPFILLMALLVRLDSPGNPFFTQVRVGKNGKHFIIFKIRTLYREHFGIVPDEEGPCDYRITRLGKYLRVSKLDELPQLLNVIFGHMSLVGPRPDIPEQACSYTPFQRQRLLIKPGLTGVAQISGNTLLSWSDRIALDIWYIKNWSCLLDFKIILFTLLAIIQGESLNADPFGLHSQLADKNKTVSVERTTE